MALGVFTLKIDVREIGQSLAGPPSSGSVTVVPNQIIKDTTPGAGAVYVRDEPYLLDVDGTLTLTLPTGVSGLQYTVTVNVDQPREMLGPITFNAPAAGAALNFKDLVPAVIIPVPTSLRGVPGGVAGLDENGDVVDANGMKILSGGGGGSGDWTASVDATKPYVLNVIHDPASAEVFVDPSKPYVLVFQ